MRWKRVNVSSFSRSIVNDWWYRPRDKSSIIVQQLLSVAYPCNKDIVRYTLISKIRSISVRGSIKRESRSCPTYYSPRFVRDIYTLLRIRIDISKTYMVSLLRSASIHSSSNSFRLESLEPKWQVIIQPRLMIIDKRNRWPKEIKYPKYSRYTLWFNDDCKLFGTLRNSRWKENSLIETGQIFTSKENRD